MQLYPIQAPAVAGLTWLDLTGPTTSDAHGGLEARAVLYSNDRKAPCEIPSPASSDGPCVPDLLHSYMSGDMRYRRRGFGKRTTNHQCSGCLLIPTSPCTGTRSSRSLCRPYLPSVSSSAAPHSGPGNAPSKGAIEHNAPIPCLSIVS